MAFPGQHLGGNPMDGIGAACCGRRPEEQQMYKMERPSSEKRPPDFSLKSPRLDQSSREEIVEWLNEKFQEMANGLEADFSSKNLSSFTGIEGRLGMLEHTQKLHALEKKKESPAKEQLHALPAKDEQSELLYERVEVLENRMKELEESVATLKDHAAKLPTQKEEQSPDHKQRTIEDDQVIASIAKRIEMGEHTMSRIEDFARNCWSEVSKLQSSIEHLDRGRNGPSSPSSPNLPSFGGPPVVTPQAEVSPAFLPPQQAAPQYYLPSPEPTREGTELFSSFDVKGQLRDLKAIVDGLQTQMRRPHAAIIDIDEEVEGINGAGVQLQVADDAESAKAKLPPERAASEVELAEKEIETWADQGYSLETNVWDASLFIGHASLAFDDSIALVFLLVLNIMVQSIFCVLAALVLSDPSFGEDQISGFAAWRIAVAGNEQLSVLSLGRRVCEGEKQYWSLEMSTTQARAVRMLREYLGSGDEDEGGADFPTGFAMCILALFCWFVSLTSELRLTIQYLSSCAEVPLGPMRITKSVNTGRITLRKMNSTRLIFISIVCMMRVAILASLAYIGTKYVVYTETVADLLLNVVALHFVLDVDKLLFGLVPASTKGLISDLEALPPPRCFKQGPFKLHWHQVVSLIGLVCMIGWAIPSIITPDLDNRRNALDALCKGNETVQM